MKRNFQSNECENVTIIISKMEFQVQMKINLERMPIF
jgi:hypothetical protein